MPRRLPLRLSLCAGLVGFLAGCGGADGWVPAKTTSASKVTLAPRLVSNPRWLPLPSPSSPEQIALSRTILHGRRLSLHPDGSIEAANQELPSSAQLQQLELPSRLGGGWLFSLSERGQTSFWRAATWLGDLEPLLSIAGVNYVAEPGFDRIYLSPQQSDELLAIDPKDWTLTDLGPLPVTSGYSDVRFLNDWVGAVDTDLRGTLITSDAGASWTEIPGGNLVNRAHKSEIRIQALGKTFALSQAGELNEEPPRVSTPVNRASDSQLSQFVHWAESLYPHPSRGFTFELPLGELPIVIASRSGWPDTPETALILTGGHLGRVRLGDGKLIDLKRNAYAGVEECTGALVGQGVGFICGDNGRASRVYQVSTALELTQVLEFDEPRAIIPSGNGGLVIRGSCKSPWNTQASAAAKGSVEYCVRSPRGALQSINFRGDYGVERVVALQDGRSAVIIPPRLGAMGSLLIIDQRGKTKTLPLKLDQGDASLITLVKKGLWLQHWTEHAAKTPPKEKSEKEKLRFLSGWVAGNGPFIGVRVHLNGRVELGELANKDLDQSLLSGPYALTVGQEGMVKETTDGGFNWYEVSTPTEFTQSMLLNAPNSSATASRPRGCSAVGCHFNQWVRVGWQGGSEEPNQYPKAEAPKAASVNYPAGNPWTLYCNQARPPEPQAKTPSPSAGHSTHIPRTSPLNMSAMPALYGGNIPTAESIEPSAWPAFLGQIAPNKGQNELGFSYYTNRGDTSLNAYIWGERSADWNQAGQWQIRVEDRFAVGNSVWSSLPARPPWQDAILSATIFGQMQRWGGYVDWRVLQGPDPQELILVLNTRGLISAFIIAENKAPIALQSSNLWPLTQATSAVLVGGTWYIGVRQNQALFNIHTIQGNELSQFLELPTRSRNNNQALQVVKSVNGEELGVLSKVSSLRGGQSRWYIFPIDMSSKKAEAPIELGPEELGAPPKACEPDAQGWQFVAEPPVYPHIQLRNYSARLNNIQARWVVNQEATCIDALSANTSTKLDALNVQAPSTSGIRLSLAAHAYSNERLPFQCSP